MRRHQRQGNQAQYCPDLLRTWQQVGKAHSEESGQVGGHHDAPSDEKAFPGTAALGRGWGVRLPLVFFLASVGPGVDPAEKPQHGSGGQAARDGEPNQRDELLEGVEAAGHEKQAG